MITDKSKKREIADLQRLLVSLGHLEWSDASTPGKWAFTAAFNAQSPRGWSRTWVS